MDRRIRQIIVRKDQHMNQLFQYRGIEFYAYFGTKGVYYETRQGEVFRGLPSLLNFADWAG